MEDDQARPLSQASPTAADVESRTKPSFMPKRRCILRCCGCCSASLILLGLTILILFLTVFKAKDPQVTMNRIRIDRLFVPGLGTADHPVSINATLTADISIKNPNSASFRFQSSVTNLYYGGETVDVVYAPGGNVRAHRTVRMNVTVDVLIDRNMNMGAKNNVGQVFDGMLDMNSYTDIEGRVKMLGIIKKHMEVKVTCSFTLDVLSRSITNRVCQTKVE